jgi:hypothetical protein
MLALGAASRAEAYSARLAWSPVAGASGYMLHVRNGGGGYGPAIDLGARTPGGDGKVRHDHGGLAVEGNYAFAISSYTASRSESPRSNELTIGYATAARIVDSDGDGLTDAQEDVNLSLVIDVGETDRRRADTDGDGHGDGAERAAGTDPLRATSFPGAPTVTRTATPVRTATRTPTPIPTPTRTATATPVRTATRTAAPTPVATVTFTATPMRTATRTPTPSPTRTPSGPPPAAPRILSVERVD